MADQLQGFLNDTSAHDSFPSGFRPSCGRETASVTLADNLCLLMDSISLAIRRHMQTESLYSEAVYL